MTNVNVAKQNSDAIKNVHFAIEKNYSKIYAKCKTEQQRKQFRVLAYSARDAFWAAKKKQLDDNNETVKSIRSDLKRITSQLNKDLASLKDVVEILKLVSEGVRLAGSLVTLA